MNFGDRQNLSKYRTSAYGIQRAALFALSLSAGFAATSCGDGIDRLAPTVSLAADTTSIRTGDAILLSWSSTAASTCNADGAWSGRLGAHGDMRISGLSSPENIFLLTCSGSGGSASTSVTVIVTDVRETPSIEMSVNSEIVESGGFATLNWSSDGATSCRASGAWDGQRPLSGRFSIGPLFEPTNVFLLNCVGPAGSITRSVKILATNTRPRFGLDFPGSAATEKTIRFAFADPLRIFPATYIWRVKPRQQSGYYTAFFWGNDDGNGDLSTFLWDSGDADSYYGAHPYPTEPPDGELHAWEIAVEREDPTNGIVVYDRWYTQALRVWSDERGRKHHEFFWDWPNTDESHLVRRVSPSDWGNKMPPSPTLTWGDAPWAPSNEIWNGVIRGIQIYSTNLSLDDIQAEIDEPLSTAAGEINIWYMNVNPQPDDILDKSGSDNNPAWIGSERPALWNGD